ncbi:hypothetical protein VTI74DRAFT_4777 [Chaetomium olivicolor]
MEALLGAGQLNPSCGSIADLQAQLRDLLSSRVTDTRADHISVTFEIRATAVFNIPVAEPETEALDNSSNIDPLLGGARTSVAPVVNGNETEPTRRVNAIDTLIDQPGADPVLQTSIARHIIASLGEVDGSNWVVRQVSHSEQGWTFTHICKDSWQAWSRQASKNPPKTAIAEWSEKGGQDPVHMARPAFDCRGSVKIAFVKSTKSIDVKYEHTQMHKTVAELIELLAPPPPAPLVKTSAKKPKETRPAKPPKEPKELQQRKSRPLKRAGEDGVPDGEDLQPNKKRKKKDSTAPVGPDGTVLPPEMLGALPVGNSIAPQLYNTQPGSSGGAQSNGSSNSPDGLVNANDGAASADVHAHSILNLPPGEAARRRDVAIKLLTDSSIDPKTLSAEQFNIFANQSPELQQDSLAMLIKYGAARLHIVHPTRDGPGSASPTPGNSTDPGGGSLQSPKQKNP